MKSYDIYNLWAVFDKATTDPSFSAEQKYSVGMDMLNALPPEMLCSSSKPSLSVVREAMVSRLTDIDNERRKSKTALRSGTPTVASPSNPEGSPEGDGVSMADMAHTDKPAKQTRKGQAKG